jgi:E3 ubiquitin-protein ligase NEDD4
LTDEGLAELNPRSRDTKSDFWFLGFVIGLAISNREVFPITFVPTFYKKLLKQTITFEDVKGFDAQLYSNLNSLRYAFVFLISRNNTSVEEESHFFSVSLEGDRVTTDLKENGDNLPVTAANVPEYLDLYTQWLLVKTTAEVFAIVASQLSLQIPDESLSFFTDSKTLDLLISGMPIINIKDWRADTK